MKSEILLNKVREVNTILQNASLDWVVTPEYHERTKEVVNSFLTAADPMDIEDEDDTTPNVGNIPNAIQVINVSGELFKLGGMDETICDLLGICDIDNVTAQIKEALDNPNVILLCLNFDTPGGQAMGCKELADLIKTAGQKMLVLGYTSTVAASGGYWLASQCSMFYCSDSSYVGNVGCYIERIDLTQQLKDNGIKVNIIKDGNYKTEGHPAEKMTKEEEAHLQERVSTIANNFRSAVLSNRNNIDLQYLQGQTFLGEQAASLNLTDGTVNDLETLLTFFSSLNYL